MPTPPPTTIDNFFTQGGLGQIVSSIMLIIGLLIVAIALLRAVKDIASGSVGKAVKSILGSFILAAFLIFPGNLIPQGIRAFKAVLVAVETTFTSTTGNSSTVTTTPPVTAPPTT
jgi:glucan phosphoethanolaminetransferase (alkaline phosphatase superfamily)